MEDVIVHLSTLGTKIEVITNKDPHNNSFVTSIWRRLYENGIEENFSLQQIETLHLKKGLLNDHGSLDGSMNMTFYGLNINDEQIIYNTDLSVVDEDRAILINHYGNNL